MMLEERFFRVLDDVEYPRRWYLKAPVTIENRAVDPWQFTAGKKLEGVPALSVPVRRAGAPLDVTLAGFDVPVVSLKAQALLGLVAAADMELIPATIVGAKQVDQTFAIMNVIRLVECLDESKSEFIKWTKADGRPDRLGAYRMVTRLVIDKSSTLPGMFRVAGWEVALIVSSKVRNILEQGSITGIHFECV